MAKVNMSWVHVAALYMFCTGLYMFCTPFFPTPPPLHIPTSSQSCIGFSLCSFNRRNEHKPSVRDPIDVLRNDEQSSGLTILEGHTPHTLLSCVNLKWNPQNQKFFTFEKRHTLFQMSIIHTERSLLIPNFSIVDHQCCYIESWSNFKKSLKNSKKVQKV